MASKTLPSRSPKNFILSDDPGTLYPMVRIYSENNDTCELGEMLNKSVFPSLFENFSLHTKDTIAS